MTIELSLLISGLSVASALYFALKSNVRAEKKDVQEETEEKATTSTMMIVKLENIADSLKDIKRENKDFREDISNLRERVATVESSLKSYHKRLDGTGSSSTQ